MVRFYLGQFIGDGNDGNEYRPPVDGDWSIIDLRADVTQQAGRCLVATSVPLATLPSGFTDLGDELDRRSAPTRNRVANALGLTLEADTLRGIIAELLVLHGRVDGSRWKPLKQNRLGRHRIVMLGETIYDAPVIVGTVIADDFTRADADAMGSSSEGWSWTETAGDIDIVTNAAEVITLGGAALARAESSLASDDHYSQVAITAWQGGTGASVSRPGVAVRYHTSDVTYYLARYETGFDRFELFRFVTGASTSIGTQAATQPTPPWTLRLEVDGSALEVFQDGVSKQTATDTNITGNVRTGLREFQGGSVTTETVFDDFEAGDLAAVATTHPGWMTSSGGWF